MKVLIVGNGAREHAIAWKVSSSPLEPRIISAPGNAGTAQLGTNFDVSAEDVEGLVGLAAEESVDLTIVGPEAPLSSGDSGQVPRRRTASARADKGGGSDRVEQVFRQERDGIGESSDGESAGFPGRWFGYPVCADREAAVRGESGWAGGGQGRNHVAEPGRGCRGAGFDVREPGVRGRGRYGSDRRVAAGAGGERVRVRRMGHTCRR